MELSKRQIELAGCLRRLLRSRFLLRRTNQKWFQAVIDLREPLQAHFTEMAVLLDINEPLGVISLRSINEEVEDILAFQMGRRKTLSQMSSLLIFHLRQLRLLFFVNPSNAEVPLVTQVELRDFLATFSTYKMDSQFEKAFRKCLEEMCEMEVLIETKEASGVFEISAICDLLLPADQIQAFHARILNYFSAAPIPTGRLNSDKDETSENVGQEI